MGFHHFSIFFHFFFDQKMKKKVQPPLGISSFFNFLACPQKMKNENKKIEFPNVGLIFFLIFF